MRKNFGPKSWLYPMPVLLIGTYDEAADYVVLGEKLGNAFKDGTKLK